MAVALLYCDCFRRQQLDARRLNPFAGPIIGPRRRGRQGAAEATGHLSGDGGTRDRYRAGRQEDEQANRSRRRPDWPVFIASQGFRDRLHERPRKLTCRAVYTPLRRTGTGHMRVRRNSSDFVEEILQRNRHSGRVTAPVTPKRDCSRTVLVCQSMSGSGVTRTLSGCAPL